MTIINLVWFGTEEPPWTLGSVWVIEPTPDALRAFREHIFPHHLATAWLFWNSRLGIPDPTIILQTLDLPGDLWHAGLVLGTQHISQIIDFVLPTWIFTLVPSTQINGTSWYVALDACLIRSEVIEQMGLIRDGFDTLDSAALDMGYRYITRGVLVRYVANLLPAVSEARHMQASPHDDLAFLYQNFKLWQFFWGVLRSILTGYLPLLPTLITIPRVIRTPRHYQDANFEQMAAHITLDHDLKVSVVIPTINRYKYLRNVLRMLRDQTLKPYEIIIVDQTEDEERKNAPYDEFLDMIQVIYSDQPGQCSSRNLALRVAKGDYFLLLDDDIEFTNDLIEQHLKTIQQYRAEISSGGIEEAGIKYPSNDKFVRIGDLLPGGNTMIKREAFEASGLFDIAFDRDKREDGELGIRMYLQGSLMVHNPRTSVFHHRSSTGGLRTFNVRGITYASSRNKLFHRHIPSPSEIYLFRRYFNNSQVNEALLQRILGTFALEGRLWRRLSKILIGLILLPNTLWKIHRNYRQASRMLQRFPDIPPLYEP